MDAIRCYSCDRNDVFSGLDTCGDVTITTDQNTKTCPETESFCMSVSATLATWDRKSALPSQKMDCPGSSSFGVVEVMLGNYGLTVQGFCEIHGSGCHFLGTVGLLEYLEICCCTDNL